MKQTPTNHHHDRYSFVATTTIDGVDHHEVFTVESTTPHRAWVLATLIARRDIDADATVDHV